MVAHIMFFKLEDMIWYKHVFLFFVFAELLFFDMLKNILLQRIFAFNLLLMFAQFQRPVLK